jgi:hypothetical protein
MIQIATVNSAAQQVTQAAAQISQSASSGAYSWLQPPTQWPAQIDVLQWCQQMNAATAAILVISGLIYLLFGSSIFKWLVTFNAAVFGAYIGALIGLKANAVIPGAMTGGFIAAALTWPLMKWAVAIMGGIYGGLLGASIWLAFRLEPHLAWSGGGMGAIFFGMLSLILFRGCVVMFLSLQGSVMLIFGILGLIYKYQSIAPQLTENMTRKPFLLAAAIFVPAILGMIFQQTQYPAAQAQSQKPKIATG